MKTTLNKSVKRVLSLCLAIVVAIGSLFVANVGVNINASAEAQNLGTVWYYSGTPASGIKDDTSATDETKGTASNPIIIESAEELAYLVKSAGSATNGNHYKLDDVDTIILQPKAVAEIDSDGNGVYDILEITSGQQAKTYLSGLAGVKEWIYVNNNNNPFGGTFDGNGASIYGMYCNRGWYMTGLFPVVSGGATIKNVAVRNSSLTSNNYGGGLVGNALAGTGILTIDSCEVTNSWIANANETNYNYRTGILLGNTAALVNVNNIIVYGSGATDTNGDELGIFGTLLNSAGQTYTNMLILDAPPHTALAQANSTNKSTNTFANIYTNGDLSKLYQVGRSETYYNGLMIPIDADSAKGALGKLAMDFDWAVDGDTENGKWYASENGYPTLFKPEGWKNCETISPWNGTAATEFAGGNGIESDPYIIETAEQLWKMVKTGGTRETDFTYKNEKGEDVTLAAGTPAYYKVKDGVENLYLSKAISGGTSAVTTLAGRTAGTDYHNWNPNAWTVFEGNFDGNGVTIRGMISKSTGNFKQAGLLGVLGKDSVVKNINFDTCYAHNTSANNSAILASHVITYKDEDADGVVTNCKYCTYYVDENGEVTGKYCDTHVNKKDDNGNIIDSDGSGKVEDCGNNSCVLSGDDVKFKCETHNAVGKNGCNIIYNVSVRNSSIKSSSNTACAGIVCVYNGYGDMLQVVNCFFDGYSCELGNGVTNGTNANAGIAAFTYGINNFQASSCVSLGAPVSSNRGTGNTIDSNYNDYTTGRKSGHPVYIYNCYTDVKENIETSVVELVDENGVSLVKDVVDYNFVANMPLLDWANGWQIVVDDNGRKVPMPRVRTAADMIATWDTGAVVLDFNRYVAYDGTGASATPYNGKDGRFYELTGSGTEADPYIISTAVELARVVAAGGTAANNSLYFKLANDIDVSGMPWVTTTGTRPTNPNETYKTGWLDYVPFVGHLDGDGHTVYGLYAVNGNADLASHNTDWQAGLIPVLDGGSITNLHIRNGYAGSGLGTTGILVGEIIDSNPNDEIEPIISGCSSEGIVDVLVGTKTAGTIVNSYINDTYYNANGAETTADAIDLTTGVWYKGGFEGAMPQLVNRAKAMEQLDVSGKGDGDYDAHDLTALQNKLLNRKAYKYIYGDVNRNGVTNIADLVVLRRAVNQSYDELVDGFWRNVELGNVAIYYSENDTQDMARKLELYFEGEVVGIDMHKYAVGNAVTDSSLTAEDKVATAPNQNAIIIVESQTKSDDPNAADYYGGYSVTLNPDTNVLTIYGGSFTAVEQAVIYFMANSNRDTNTIYTVEKGDILAEKQTDKIVSITGEDSNSFLTYGTSDRTSSYKSRVVMGGKTYYYAWSDEFQDNANETINSNNWKLNAYRNEDAGDMYDGKENANLKDFKDLWVVNEGRLQIWRGVNTDLNNDKSTWSWGYKGISLGVNTKNDFGRTIDEDDVYIDPGMITTLNSMLFKQGYVEMEASLPSDGHAFPAWWFLTYNSGGNNNSISNSLYGKIFKFNNVGSKDTVWDGTTTGNFTPGVLSTYKYQVPTAHLEFDIVEPMQTKYNYTGTTAYKHGTDSDIQKQGDLANHYKSDFSVTIHKIYTEHSKDGVLSIVDWNEETGGSVKKTISLNDFNTTSSGSFVHRYNNGNYVGNYGYDVGNTSWWGNGTEEAGYLLGRKMTGTIKYGFAWYVNVKNSTYKIDIYMDTDGDGDMQDESAILTVNEKTGHGSANNKTISDYLYNNGKDPETWNQYAYMLLDNAFYTGNDNGGVYTDVLTQNESGTANTGIGGKYENYKLKDKATLEVNYIRIYQQDNRRDIVTPDTEAFNNGNHFGYVD